MKLPLNMLRDYVEIPVTPAEYAERMIMTGTAVEGLEALGGEIVTLTTDPAANARWTALQTRADVYRIFLDFYGRGLAGALRAIAWAPPGGIVFHCLGGTDRTGLVAALALRLAGVPDEVIAADYEMTLARRRSIYAQLVAEKGEANLGFWDKLNMTADNMLATLAYLDTQHGGERAYLHANGLADEDMERVRGRLWGDVVNPQTWTGR